MAHTLQDRYSPLVLAKIRKENKLKNGVVFNTDYEGSPKAGIVKIPVRDTEVAVSDYDKANGITAGTGSTTYENFPINKDKGVNEIIDGYNAQAVPDNLVADRLDSAGYSLASQEDNDGATVLLAGATNEGAASLTKDTIYAAFVDTRTAMSKANIPDDGKRYALVTPDTMALVLKSPEFIKASDLGDAVVQSGIIGKIAGFNIIEWNDSTANLAYVAGHPRFATRAEEFSVPVHIQDLSGSGKYIGASAVQGRLVYGHKVLRSTAIRAVYSPAALALTVAVGTSNSGDTKVTATATGSNTLAYKKNPSARIAYGTASTTYAGTSMTSGTAKVISGCSVGDIIEVAEFDETTSNCVSVGYVTLTAADIKA
jgi:hypothetical protein